MVAGLSVGLGVVFLVLGRLFKEPWRSAKDGEDTVHRNFFNWAGVFFVVAGLLRLLF